MKRRAESSQDEEESEPPAKRIQLDDAPNILGGTSRRAGLGTNLLARLDAVDYGLDAADKTLVIEEIAEREYEPANDGWIRSRETGKIKEGNESMPPNNGPWMAMIAETKRILYAQPKFRFYQLTAGLLNHAVEEFIDDTPFQNTIRAEREYADLARRERNRIMTSVREKERQMNYIERQLLDITNQNTKVNNDILPGARRTAGQTKQWPFITGHSMNEPFGLLFPYYMKWQYLLLRDQVIIDPAVDQSTRTRLVSWQADVLTLLRTDRDHVYGGFKRCDRLRRLNAGLLEFLGSVSQDSDEAEVSGIRLLIALYVVLRDAVLLHELPFAFRNPKALNEEDAFDYEPIFAPFTPNSYRLTRVLNHHLVAAVRSLPGAGIGISLPDDFRPLDWAAIPTEQPSVEIETVDILENPMAKLNAKWEDFDKFAAAFALSKEEDSSLVAGDGLWQQNAYRFSFLLSEDDYATFTELGKERKRLNETGTVEEQSWLFFHFLGENLAEAIQTDASDSVHVPVTIPSAAGSVPLPGDPIRLARLRLDLNQWLGSDDETAHLMLMLFRDELETGKTFGEILIREVATKMQSTLFRPLLPEGQLPKTETDEWAVKDVKFVHAQTSWNTIVSVLSTPRLADYEVAVDLLDRFTGTIAMFSLSRDLEGPASDVHRPLFALPRNLRPPHNNQSAFLTENPTERLSLGDQLDYFVANRAAFDNPEMKKRVLIAKEEVNKYNGNGSLPPYWFDHGYWKYRASQSPQATTWANLASDNPLASDPSVIRDTVYPLIAGKFSRLWGDISLHEGQRMFRLLDNGDGSREIALPLSLTLFRGAGGLNENHSEIGRAAADINADPFEEELDEEDGEKRTSRQPRKKSAQEAPLDPDLISMMNLVSQVVGAQKEFDRFLHLDDENSASEILKRMFGAATILQRKVTFKPLTSKVIFKPDGLKILQDHLAFIQTKLLPLASLAFLADFVLFTFGKNSTREAAQREQENARTALRTEIANLHQGVDKIPTIAQAAQKLYLPIASYSGRPDISGVIILTDPFLASIEEAHNLVQKEIRPEQLTANDLMTSGIDEVVFAFADLVASCGSKRGLSNNPDVFPSNYISLNLFSSAIARTRSLPW